MKNVNDTIVEVFATSVQHAKEAADIVALFRKKFPDIKVNFDLEDCDHIFRAAGHSVDWEEVRSIFTSRGYNCKRLT